MSLVKQIIESPEKSQRMEKLVKEEDRTIPATAKGFKDMVKRLAKRVGLGNHLKGKCKYCQ